MSLIDDKQKEIVTEFTNLVDWESRYKKIIEYGRGLAEIDSKYKNEEYRVKGCTSQVWMFAELDSDKNIVIYGDSDAMIVRGLVALLIKIFSGSKPLEVVHSSISFVNEIGLADHLTPSRANGLNSMIKQIKYYALALSAM